MSENQTPSTGRSHDDQATSWVAPGSTTPSWGQPEDIPAPPSPSDAPPVAHAAPAPSPGAASPLPPHYWAGAPQPGIVPLRPLTLGDLFEATFRAVRSNPTVMFGFSVILMTVLSLLSLFFTWMAGGEKATLLFLDPQASTQLEGMDESTMMAQMIAEQFVSSVVTAVTSGIGGLILSGILAITVAEAVLGRILGIDEAWRRLLPRLWPLFLTTLLTAVAVGVPITLTTGLLVLLAVGASQALGVGAGLVLTILLGGLCIAALTIFLNVKLVFAVVASVIEEARPTVALKRSWALTRGAFWRIFGRMVVIYLMTGVLSGILVGVVGVANGIISVAVSAQIALNVATLAGGILSGLVVPISAAFTTLMYLDERIRSENLAPVLLAAAQE